MVHDMKFEKFGVKWILTSIFIVIFFEIKLNIYLIWSLVSPSMSCQMRIRFVCFLALVALEWSLHHVRRRVGFQIARLGGSKVALVTTERSFSCVLLHHVNFQIARLGAGKVALVTFEWSFSCMLSHHVVFQLISCNARILARCASLWLFTGVRLLVSLQVAWLCCFIFALIAIV